MRVACNIEGLDGKYKLKFTVFTVEKITGDTKAMD